MYEYTIEDIWHQAVNDSMSVNTSFEGHHSYLFKGIKIVKQGKRIVIYNTKLMGLNYNPVLEDELYYFLMHGFREGVINVLKCTYLKKINLLNDKIKVEMNNRNNLKHYQSLKNRREELINKYSKISKSL
jgi:hypothetical protein